MTKKTNFSQGVLTFTRNEVSTEYTCERCNSIKKSKIVVKWKDNSGNEKTICNGCYGLLLLKKNNMQTLPTLRSQAQWQVAQAHAKAKTCHSACLFANADFADTKKN